MSTRLALLVSGAGVLAIASPALGTTGNLYELGSSPGWATGSQFSSSVANDVWTVRAGALNPALEGSKWEMNWGCPAPGSVISQVKWGALRTAGPSHMEVDVLADGARVWATPDTNIPMAPAGGRAFDIGIAAGSCNVHLRLVQRQTVAQGARTYFIDHPRIVVRDLAAPTVAIDALQQGWVNAAQSHSEIGWTTRDNFGSDGITEQRVSIGGRLHYRGTPGAGTHRLNAGIAPVGDGVHTVLVEADGDGTAGAAATGRLSVDRTPPGASNLTAGATSTPREFRIAADGSDATSGVHRIAIEVNSAADGGVGGAWREIHAVDGARVAAAVTATGVADGIHAWRARVSDRAGNHGYVVAPGPLVVDTTPPELEIDAPDPTPVRRVSLSYRVGDNLEGVLGVGPTEIAVNSAADGTAGGAWLPLPSGPGAPGTHTAQLDLSGLADGVHLVRLRARNGGPLGDRLTTERALPVSVDNTSPRVTDVDFRSTGGRRVLVSWIAQDAGSGVARAVVQRRTAEGWQTLRDAPAKAGTGSAQVDVSGLKDGTVDLRLLVHDGAGNTSEHRAAAGTGVDGTPPSVTDLRLAGPPWAIHWSQSDAGGGLSRCPTSIQISGPGTAGIWRELVERRLPAGRHRVALPLAGLTPGAYRARVVACDRSGNKGSAIVGGLLLTTADLAAAGSPGNAALARFRGASLSQLRVRGARVHHKGRRRTLVVRRAAGRVIVIEGRLRDRRRRALARVLVHARGHDGRRIGAARTDRNGRFRLRARPVASGPIGVGIPAGRALIPRTTSPAVRASVATRVVLRTPRGRSARGRSVTFSGRLVPSPARLGGPGRKTVVLEWLDPLRGRWRPVVNGRSRTDGRFSLRWRFGVSGLTIPMRVRVPAERGWPLRPGRSRVVRVTPGG